MCVNVCMCVCYGRVYEGAGPPTIFHSHGSARFSSWCWVSQCLSDHSTLVSIHTYINIIKYLCLLTPPAGSSMVSDIFHFLLNPKRYIIYIPVFQVVRGYVW